MISRDLTCNETMPPLDDGDTKTDLNRTRNGKAITGRSSSGTIVPKPSPEFGTTGSLNHMTTVRDVVTRHFRNSKLNASADLSFVDCSKLGGILSSIGGRFDVISHGSQNQQQRHVLITNQDCNGFAHSSADFHHRSMAPPAHSSAEEAWRHPHLSPSSTSSSTSTPPSSTAPSGNFVVTKHNHLDISTKSGHYPPSASNSLLSNLTPSSSSSSSLLHPINKSNNTTANYFVKTVPIDGGTTSAAFISPPLSTGATIEQQQQQQIVQPGSQNAFFQQQQSQWAIYPPVEPSVQQQRQHLKSGGVVPCRASAASVRIAPPRPPRQMGEARTKQQMQKQQNKDEHRIPAPTTVPSVAIVLQQQPPSAPISPQKQQQQQHTSPRPGILRGNASAVRRLTVDRDRPASVSGSFINNSEESPRKRRKQHFDNSQLLGDKVTVEMRPNDRLGQSASAGPLLAGCWRNSSGSVTAEGGVSTQQRPFIADPLARVGAANSGKKAVSGVPIEGKQQPKKRGRPKMNCQTQQLPLLSTNATTKSVQQKQKNNHRTEERAGDIAKNQPKHRKLALGNHLTMTTLNESAKTSKSKQTITVQVEHITETEQKKRKYQKRTPNIDPLTGARKVRKKGSGRKSKKELAAKAANGGGVFGTDGRWVPTEAQPAKSDANSVPNHKLKMEEFDDSHQSTQMQASEMMSETAAERDVINTLCRFKRDKDIREMLAEQTTLISTSFATNSSSKCVVDQSDAVDEHNQKPSCSYGISKTERNQPLPLLADLNKLGILRPLLRRCERGLNSTDNCHLGESYEEICNFLRSSNRQPMIDSSESAVRAPKNRSDNPQHLTVPKHLDERCVDRLSADIFCSIFDSYDEFKKTTNSMRLLPVACAYFDASQRLLSSLRTSLRGFSLYHALQMSAEPTIKEKNMDEILVEESDRWFFGDGLVGIEEAETERDDDAEGEREDRLSRAFFAKLDKEYQNLVGRQCWDDDKQNEAKEDISQPKMAQQLLLQLDVAQTLDLVLHNVENDSSPISMHRFHSDHSQRSYALPSEPSDTTDSFKGHNETLSLCDYQIDKRNLPDDLSEILWTKRKVDRTLNGGRKRKRSETEVDEDKKEEEEEKEQKESERHAMTSQQSSPPLLKSIERYCAESATESAFLDAVVNSLGQRMANCQVQDSSFAAKASSSSDSILKCQSAADRTTAKRKRNNNNNSTAKAQHQFVFRPSSRMVGELFKFVQKLELCETSAMEKSGERIDAREVQQRENDNVVTTQSQPQQQKLLKADLEEMMSNCQRGSAMAMEQLRHKYTEILNGELSSSSRNAIGDGTDCTPQPFDRALRFQFSRDSTRRDKQSRFLEKRLKGLQEICATTLSLSRARAALAGQCAESVRETLEEMERQQQRRTKEQSLGARLKSATTALKRVPSLDSTMMNPSRPASHSPSLAKLGTVRVQHSARTTAMSKPKQHHQRQRRILSLEEEEQEDEQKTPTSGRGTPIEPQQGRQSPAKRAAHQRALTQMIISATASD